MQTIQSVVKQTVPRPGHLALIMLVLYLCAQFTNTYGSTYEARSAEAIDYFANIAYTKRDTPKYTFFYAEAKFYDYEVNHHTPRLADALNLVDAGLDHLNEKDPPFQLWRAMDCYLRYGHLYPEGLKTKMRDKMINSPHFDYHNTQNKIWMAATARYLAQETWSGHTFKSGYSHADPTGKATLLDKMTRFVHEGETEHNSPTYYAMHYGPLRSLADFARDPEIKNKAYLTAEWLLAAAAGEWLDGLWCAPAERIYAYNTFGAQTVYGAGTSTLRLYFDGPTPTNWNSELVDVVQAIGSAYRMPVILKQIAQDRGAPFTHQETHDSVGTQFFCTTYMTPTYALYSQHEAFNRWGSRGGMDQVQRWSVAFKRPQGHAHSFVQHPTDTKVANMGSTEYGQVLQSKNALIGVWNIPATNVVGHKGQQSSNPIRGWIPEDPSAKINESDTTGRLYLHYNNVMIALYLSEPFSWDGTSTHFTLPATRLGMVVELASPGDHGPGTPVEQLARFQAAFEHRWQQRVDISGVPDVAPALTYHALDGTRLETRFKKMDTINGTPVTYTRDRWPLLGNPWINQAYQGDILTLTHGDSTRRYDFTNWTVSTHTATMILPTQ